MPSDVFTDELLKALRLELLRAAEENRKDREIRRDLLDVVSKLHASQDAIVTLLAQLLERMPPRPVVA